ncbi:MAG: hypothetical protein H6702_12285 [Myxococcales bacterium]|nr:hypothetical protein [Myxococcales bacterium]
MDFGEALEKIITLVVVLNVLRGLVGRLTGHKAGEAQSPEPLARPPAMDGPEAHAGWADQARLRFADALRQAEGLAARLDDLHRSLAADDPRTADLRDIIRHPTQSTLDEALIRLQRGVALAASAEPGDLEVLVSETPLYAEAFEALGATQTRAAVIEGLVRARRAEVGFLGDADAVARALLAPLTAFAQAEGVPLPAQRPICVPADQDAEMVILGLFPDHPVIFVPRDFGDEVPRWPAVAHEVGHVFWRAVPGFADEAAFFAPGAGPAWLPRQEGRKLLFDLGAALGAWQMELVCDAFAVLLTGPAGLRGLVHAFEDAGDPQAVARAHVGFGGRTLDEHPPAELRVRVAARVLDRMGFDREAKALLGQWVQLHGEQPHLVIPTLFGSALGWPIEAVEDAAWKMIRQMLDHRFASLGGRGLESVPGLAVGPGLWGRALARVPHLLEGVAFNDDPRVVLMAAVEAAAEHPNTAVLMQRIRQAIRGDGEYRVGTHAYDLGGPAQPASLDAPLTRQEVVDAIILHAALDGVRRRWR